MINNQRIIAEFDKEHDGLNGHVIKHETIKFDATPAVLSMDLETIHGIMDANESSDEVSRGLVEHDGPFTVRVEEGIKTFFGVSDLEHITQDMLVAARAAAVTVDADAPIWHEGIPGQLKVRLWMYRDNDIPGEERNRLDAIPGVLDLNSGAVEPLTQFASPMHVEHWSNPPEDDVRVYVFTSDSASLEMINPETGSLEYDALWEIQRAVHGYDAPKRRTIHDRNAHQDLLVDVDHNGCASIELGRGVSAEVQAFVQDMTDHLIAQGAVDPTHPGFYEALRSTLLGFETDRRFTPQHNAGMPDMDEPNGYAITQQGGRRSNTYTPSPSQ